MKIKMIFENLYSANMLIEKDFISVNKNCNDVMKEIVSDFTKIFNKMAALHPEQFKYENIDICFIEYQTKSSSNTLGYFNPEKSIRNNAYYFGLYYDTCKDYLLNKWQNKEKTSDKYEGLWEHEIIHMLDFSHITNFRTNLNKLIKTELKPLPVYSAISNTNNTPKDYWYLLDVINLMRVEGLATLYECMCGLRTDNIKDVSTLKRNLIFQLDTVISTVHGTNSASGNKLVEFTRSLCYETGKWIIVHILSGKENEACKAIADKMIATGDFYVEEHERNVLMRTALQVDFEEFLTKMLELSNPEKQLFDSFSLINRIAFLSGGKIEDEVSVDLYQLYNASRTLNQNQFIAILSKYVGAKMKEEEIVQSFTDFKSKPETDNYLETVILQKTEMLYQRWQNDKGNDLLAYTLTYILDDQEMIPDDVQFLGYLDDMAVIDAAEFILAT